MRILYSVCGEGNGHATRSQVSAARLIENGHDVLFVASGQAIRTLGQHYPDRVTPIVGLSMVCYQGALDLHATADQNLSMIPSMVASGGLAWLRAEEFQPNAVVTDVEHFGWIFARSHDLPVVSIDNQMMIRRCRHAEGVFGSHTGAMQAYKMFCESRVPNADHFIVTSFFFPELVTDCLSSTTLVKPILRQKVIDLLAKPPQASSGKLLVYKTSSLDDESMVRALSAVPNTSFVVYGAKKDCPLPANALWREYSEDGFLQDISTCEGVISNGGMGLTGEALAFGKPILAIPVRGQLEQVTNASYLARLHYGVFAEKLDGLTLDRFCREIPHLARTITHTHQHDRNERLYSTLDKLFGRSDAA